MPHKSTHTGSRTYLDRIITNPIIIIRNEILVKFSITSFKYYLHDFLLSPLTLCTIPHYLGLLYLSSIKSQLKEHQHYSCPKTTPPFVINSKEVNGIRRPLDTAPRPLKLLTSLLGHQSQHYSNLLYSHCPPLKI